MSDILDQFKKMNMQAPETQYVPPASLIASQKEFQEILSVKNRRDAQRDAAILQTAQMNVEQSELLKTELNESRIRNKLLEEQCNLLKENAENSARAADTSKKYNSKMMKIAIGAGIVSIGSLIANIIMILIMLNGG